MKIYNVIEKDGNEVFVYSFSTKEKANEYFDKCKKHLLRMNNCKDDGDLKQKYDIGEDTVIIKDDYIDIYECNYELYIQENNLDVGFNFDDME